VRKYLCFFAFLSTVAFASTDGTLYLVGSIPTRFDLRIDPVIGQQDSLDIAGGETALKVADVAEISNFVNGYEVFIESVNGGELTHSDGVNSVSYQIQYGVGGPNATPPVLGAPLSVKTSGALTGLSFDFEEVFITFTGDPNLPAGAYTDTLVISMEAL